MALEPAKPAVVAATAASILKSAEAVWVPLSSLADQIAAAGVRIGGDPLGNLSTILSRHKEELRLTHEKKRGWALLERAAAELA